MMKSCFTLLVLVVCSCVVKGDDWGELASGFAPLKGVAFFNATVGVIVAYQKIHRTIDGGATWELLDMTGGLQTARYQDVYAYDKYSVAAGVGDSGLVPGSSYSIDMGQTFYQTDETHLRQTWWDVKSIPGYDGAFVKSGSWVDALRSGSGVSISSNGGSSWTDHDWGFDVPALFCSFVSTSTGWIAGGISPDIFNTTAYRATLAKTTNSGYQWTLLSDVSADYYYSGIAFADTNNGWLVSVNKGGGSSILHTTDGGATWTTQITLNQGKLKDIFMFDKNEGWVVGGYEDGAFYNGQLLHTTDGGQSWMPYSKRGYILDHVFGLDNTHVYASGLSETGGGVVVYYQP